MKEQIETIPEIIRELDKKMPHFPDGRINFSDSSFGIAINVIIENEGHILILKRSNKVAISKEKWAVIGGHYDELKTIKEKVLEEIFEETRISEGSIKSMELKKEYEFFDNTISRKWIIFPVLVRLFKKPEIRLDWEHTEYKWIFPDELDSFDPPESVLKIMDYFFNNSSE